MVFWFLLLDFCQKEDTVAAMVAGTAHIHPNMEEHMHVYLNVNCLNKANLITFLQLILLNIDLKYTKIQFLIF